MKIISFTTLLLFLLSSRIQAQSLQGHNWIIGFSASENFPVDSSGGLLMDFTSGSLVYSKVPLKYTMASSSIISDTLGNLLFYSDGCRINKRDYTTMPGSDSMNDHHLLDLCMNGSGYSRTSGLIILPDPGGKRIYRVFHNAYYVKGLYGSQMRMTTVDMTLDNGMGRVTEKKKILIDSANIIYLSTVKHANGRDWWIVNSERGSNRKFVFLLDLSGIHGPEVIKTGGVKLANPEAWGQMLFSPDGKKFLELTDDGSYVCDFNRCSGKFSNCVKIDYFEGAALCNSGAFSSNSRMLFVSTCDSIFQYDLQSPDFNLTRQLIAVQDGISDLYNTSFFGTMTLAPDDKIYINQTTGGNKLSVIHQPNQRGLAAGFEKWGFDMPVFNASEYLPNLPNHQLGADLSLCSDCDTLPNPPLDLMLYPNPANTYTFIGGQVSQGDYPLKFQLFDMLGRLLLEESIACLPHRIPTSNFPAAAYSWRAVNQSGNKIRQGVLIKR